MTRITGILSFFFLLTVLSCQTESKPQLAPQWLEVEIDFISEQDYENPYTDVEFWVEFTHESGELMIRPGFWYENSTWKVRFASPFDEGQWEWESFTAESSDKGLAGKTGKLRSAKYEGNNPLIANGLLRMSKGKRNVVHASGKTFLVVGDTPWALPWRGTIESVNEYAKNRQERFINAALLMSLQPDRDAEGPRSRTEALGFDVAFEDLKDGHINKLNPQYFQYFDTLRNILIEHGIVPVYQPVFHGFGWKGLNVLGWDMESIEYARYCRYLVARYGAKPAIWLVSGDSDSRDKGVLEGGEEIEKWDAYKQPTGQHYSPFCEVIPDWWDRPYEYIPHQNKVNQDKNWLDFQWCQSGHAGEHQSWKVEKMYVNLPVKAAANAEPTYEGIRDPDNGAGWWQGHEAWLNFTSGGTMGVVYGAGGLWNWKLDKDEPGWPDWANSDVSWKEAIQLPGSRYVGYMGKALEELDMADIEKHPELAGGKLCLAKPGKLYIVYLPEGGALRISDMPEDLKFRWFNPLDGVFYAEGTTSSRQEFTSEKGKPSVLIINENQ